jgi:hypothetical protein
MDENASTKFPEMIVEDQLVQDEILRRCGLPINLPPKCKACRIALPSLREEHGVLCANARGGAGLAGGFIERAILDGCHQLGLDPKRKPPLDEVPGFGRLTQGPAKLFGDGEIHFGDRFWIIDTTFSSNVSQRPVAEKERAKIKEYKKNRNPAAVDNIFVPCAIDLMGNWGQMMQDLFDSIVEDKKNACPQMKKSIAMSYRFMREKISIATIKAIGAYMKIVRYGDAKKEVPADEADLDQHQDQHEATQDEMGALAESVAAMSIIRRKCFIVVVIVK